MIECYKKFMTKGLYLYSLEGSFFLTTRDVERLLLRGWKYGCNTESLKNEDITGGRFKKSFFA